LEEPIDIIKHDLLYRVNFKGKKVDFWPDINAFTEELAKIFPSEKENIKHFYKDMGKMYQHVMVENPNYTTPDETDFKEGLKSLLKHPISYAKFLGFIGHIGDGSFVLFHIVLNTSQDTKLIPVNPS